jgi:hypothetical protein
MPFKPTSAGRNAAKPMDGVDDGSTRVNRQTAADERCSTDNRGWTTIGVGCREVDRVDSDSEFEPNSGAFGPALARLEPESSESQPSVSLGSRPSGKCANALNTSAVDA